MVKHVTAVNLEKECSHPDYITSVFAGLKNRVVLQTYCNKLRKFEIDYEHKDLCRFSLINERHSVIYPKYLKTKIYCIFCKLKLKC